MKKSNFAKILFIAAAVMLFSTLPAFAEAKAFSPDEHLQTADKTLNNNYKRIQTLYAGDKLFLEKLKASQRAWIKFRDAEIEAIFPHSKEGNKYYGSTYSEARTHWLAVLTEERSVQLARWLEGTGKEDIYRGSVRVKPVK